MVVRRDGSVRVIAVIIRGPIVSRTARVVPMILLPLVAARILQARRKNLCCVVRGLSIRTMSVVKTFRLTRWETSVLFTTLLLTIFNAVLGTTLSAITNSNL